MSNQVKGAHWQIPINFWNIFSVLYAAVIIDLFIMILSIAFFVNLVKHYFIILHM